MMDTSSQAALDIVVAEDEDLIRGSVVRKIEAVSPAFRVSGAAQDGKEALEMIRRKQPDLVVTDIRMPVMDGIALIRELHLYYPRIRAVITSGYADFEYARQAMQLGVVEYMLKPLSAEELKRVLLRIQSAVAGERDGIDSSAKALQPPGASPEEIVRNVQAYMREQFRGELSLELIARQFNFNPSYLSKIFQRYTGDPPSRYLMALRINEAKYLLVHHPCLSVKEVGERVGYPDQFYFSRIFKQMTGCTPKDYQKGQG